MQGPPAFDKAQMFREAYRATPEQFQVFVRGMEAVLNQWVALLLVAEHCDTRALPTLFQHLVDLFDKKGEVYSDELEDVFDEFFTMSRNVMIQDESTKEVGDTLYDMYCRCCRNDFSSVEHFINTMQIFRQENPLALCVNGAPENELEGAGNLYEEEEEGGEEELDPNAPPPAESAPAAPKNKKKKKNDHVKTAGGWNLVL
ncbi:pre-rRNA-processing protein TSR2 [Angomonas deanei]|uniref:Pre-rRNA-processing protein TSR2 n=1 Tax=Angomonas deanei TaxID=59799 RepID=A0A7G2C8R1_9TRYP|nr:pre-rRNA-processing protein TSR2 [Angomonas deanei]CAD2215504.1 hypothetical protein, conserved [Angomonas deanei]|eukprot:EPY22658.1 pre-rRNA-processing protein TSR2 [Angomonas deanei]